VTSLQIRVVVDAFTRSCYRAAMKGPLAIICALGFAGTTDAMYLDKATNELVLRIVYAGDGDGALDDVTLLASAAKPGLATPVISRVHGAVRTFTVHLDPSIGTIRGFAPRVDVVGVSLDRLRSAMGSVDAAAMEKTVLRADGLVFVVGPDAAGAKAELERLSEELRAVGTNGAKTPVAIIATTGFDAERELGAKDVPIATGRRAAFTALKATVKPILLDVLKRSSEAQQGSSR
jgi:hypothetical protein